MNAVKAVPADRMDTYVLHEASDGELVAALLEDERSRATRRLAADLLDRCGGLQGLLHAPQGQLVTLGATPLGARRLQAALAAGVRAATQPPAHAPLDAATLAEMFRPRLGRLRHEELHVVLLDGGGRFLGERRVAHG